MQCASCPTSGLLFLGRNFNLLVQYHNKLGMMCYLVTTKNSAITSNMLNTHVKNIFLVLSHYFSKLDLDPDPFFSRLLSTEWVAFSSSFHLRNFREEKKHAIIFTKLFYGWHQASIFVCIIISRKSFKNKNTTSFLQMWWKKKKQLKNQIYHCSNGELFKHFTWYWDI